jgi:hypothetical protein
VAWEIYVMVRQIRMKCSVWRGDGIIVLHLYGVEQRKVDC